MMSHQPLPASQRGAVLITSLIFLVMLTVVAVVANQSTVLETRMSTNSIVKARAVESSEALRTLSHELIATSCYNHGWPDSITGLTGGTVREDEFHIPTGVDVNTPVDWCTENPAGELLLDSTSWQKDLTLLVDSNTDSDYVDDGDQHVEFARQYINGGCSASDAQPLFKPTCGKQITRVGKFLRKSSIDELPQLFNVIRGNMSLVGPRPVPAYEVAEYQPWHRERLNAVPGIALHHDVVEFRVQRHRALRRPGGRPRIRLRPSQEVAPGRPAVLEISRRSAFYAFSYPVAGAFAFR